MEKVEKALTERGAARPADRTARFVSVLCLAWPDGHTEFFRGEVEGAVVWPPRGEKGFGYDPVFQPEGHALTFGEMSSDEKHGWKPGEPEALSHRARAFKRFVETCLEASAPLNPVAPLLADTGEPGFGIYVHWPFCAAKCPYCDFNSHVRHQPVDQPRFTAAFLREME